MKKIYTTLFVLFICNYFVTAQDANNKVKFSGVVFTDYYYNIDNVTASKKDSNGFQFRRAYFTADIYLADNFDSRFRLDADQTTSSLTAGGKLGVAVKDAYVRWKSIFSGSDVIVGLSPTPLFEVSEAAWGYRSLEKTPLDLWGLVSTRDIGIDLRGKLTDNGSVNYWVKIGNNSNNAPESDKYKRYYAMLHFKPVAGLQLQVYGDVSSRAQKFEKISGTYKSNTQYIGSFLAGYKYLDVFSVGTQIFTSSALHNYSKTSTAELLNQGALGYSIWASGSLSDKFKLVCRFDRYDPNTDVNNDATSFVVAGLEYQPVKNISIIPNFELFKYQGKDGKDFTGRITFAYTY